MNPPPLGALGIVRLGLVQSALGGIVMLVTSMLNRIMVVEYALPALLPAALIAWHYAVQLSRPVWGHAADVSGQRKRWIIAGMAMLALGALVATNAVFLIAVQPVAGILLATLGFTLIGAGVGASGTSLLALLASRLPPERLPAAAATTWIMMVAGIALTAGISSQFLDPFTPERLAMVAGAIALFAFLLTLAAVAGVAEGAVAATDAQASRSLGTALSAIWAAPRVRHFTLFVFVSMLAYAMQDVILEPFAGLVFGYSPGESTALSGLQNGAALVGMLLVGVGGKALARRLPGGLATVVALGCLCSAAGLLLLAVGARVGPGFPLEAAVLLLGFGNGSFAVGAVAAMMALARADGPGEEGVRLGLWGASQAIAFGLGGLVGAAGVDVGRAWFAGHGMAFSLVFAVEAAFFVVAAGLARGIGRAEGVPPAGAHPGMGAAA
jgi:BCD family chlorophyll transporter-like MFS transporter